jgi:hypothetical protein
MTAKQTAKHIADHEAEDAAYNSLNVVAVIEPTPDGLGLWEGGVTHLSIDRHKAKPQRTGDTKNKPGIDYPTKITHRQDRDFNEIHVEENGDVLLYNVKTNAWDIKGDSADLPYYEDETGTWGYNVKTGKWDVLVTYEEHDGYVAPLMVEESDNISCDADTSDVSAGSADADPTPTA